ncbi:hypothetical protein COLINT_02384 [Collinsella intestinalis DSM 13280]|uniref:Uncharacterized protein n=1 Tax=Collinsella intestinalis DSM 13280 TaxID=521003 RepID=C4F8L4_9ACTN|nr:hypothetical protein COLINT_02384 [Collinsella intestinalis DSM 13280]
MFACVHAVSISTIADVRCMNMLAIAQISDKIWICLRLSK